jgi:hypothetical protein
MSGSKIVALEERALRTRTNYFLVRRAAYVPELTTFPSSVHVPWYLIGSAFIRSLQLLPEVRGMLVDVFGAMFTCGHLGAITTK